MEPSHRIYESVRSAKSTRFICIIPSGSDTYIGEDYQGTPQIVGDIKDARVFSTKEEIRSLVREYMDYEGEDEDKEQLSYGLNEYGYKIQPASKDIESASTSGSYRIYLSSAAGLDYSGVTATTEKEAKDLVRKWNDEELEGNPYAQYVYRKQ